MNTKLLQMKASDCIISKVILLMLTANSLKTAEYLNVVLIKRLGARLQLIPFKAITHFHYPGCTTG